MPRPLANSDPFRAHVATFVYTWKCESTGESFELIWEATRGDRLFHFTSWIEPIHDVKDAKAITKIPAPVPPYGFGCGKFSPMAVDFKSSVRPIAEQYFAFMRQFFQEQEQEYLKTAGVKL